MDNAETFSVNDPSEIYGLNDLIYKDEVYEIISCCMEVHRELGRGFLEAVYKEALTHEFDLRGISYEPEKEFRIGYKGKLLSKYYRADFLVMDKIILEAKAQKFAVEDNFRQTINYLAVSRVKLGLLVNFGEDSLKFRRVVL